MGLEILYKDVFYLLNGMIWETRNSLFQYRFQHSLPLLDHYERILAIVSMHMLYYSILIGGSNR